MAYRAIATGILSACGLAALLLLAAWLLQPTSVGVPQTLTLFAIWILPGFVAAARAGEAGILHGMLTGLFGMLGVYLGIQALVRAEMISLAFFVDKPPLIFLLLAGFWASLGGMIADSIRLIKAKRAAREESHPRGESK